MACAAKRCTFIAHQAILKGYKHSVNALGFVCGRNWVGALTNHYVLSRQPADITRDVLHITPRGEVWEGEVWETLFRRSGTVAVTLTPRQHIANSNSDLV